MKQAAHGLAGFFEPWFAQPNGNQTGAWFEGKVHEFVGRIVDAMGRFFPFLMGAMGVYGMGLMTLSLCYVIPTYFILALPIAGAPVKLAGYVRFVLGEGIERKESDFAAEVAATLKPLV